ncbi:MAG: Y-family DNA polymerase [Bacteroidaceae bacterium]|nr:Y-family DNA polymerase [Bacteroidaceae bacterium]
MFGLCDCNNFFVSCERVFNPSLNGRPVVVLSNNDGCVVSRSNEAKAIGIKMGEPLFQIQNLVNLHDVAVFSANYHLYGDMSQRVMETLKAYVPFIEIYSIDEAFLDLSGYPIERLGEFGRELSRIVKRNTGIPVSIGISPTKTLAKIASKLCKKYPKLQGACLMYRDEDIAKVLSTYPIEDVWGIGRKHTKRLYAAGVPTAAKLCEKSEEWVKNMLSITGVRTWLELRGTPSIEFSHQIADKQTITVSRSFATEIYNLEELREAISTFAAMAAEKLRRQHSVAGELQVFILTNRHRDDRPQHREGRIFRFETSTCSTIEITKAATDILKGLYRPGFGYKKSGVTLGDITPDSAVQHSLFDTVDHSKHKLLMQAMDNINSTIGRDSVRIVSQGAIDEHVNRRHLSPQYTTKWDDIIVVKV